MVVEYLAASMQTAIRNYSNYRHHIEEWGVCSRMTQCQRVVSAGSTTSWEISWATHLKRAINSFFMLLCITSIIELIRPPHPIIIQWVKDWAVWKPMILANKEEKIVGARSPWFCMDMRLCPIFLERPVTPEDFVSELESHWKRLLDVSNMIDCPSLENHRAWYPLRTNS